MSVENQVPLPEDGRMVHAVDSWNIERPGLYV